MLRKRPSSRVHTFLARWGADARAAAYAPNGAGAKRARTTRAPQSSLSQAYGRTVAARTVWYPIFPYPQRKRGPRAGQLPRRSMAVSKMPARTKNDADGGLGTW